jgi:hypothetical protein
MNIEISKHGLNFGEDLEYVSTFIKGKGKSGVDNYRILVRGVKTGREMILFLEHRPNFFGRKDSCQIAYIDEFKYITSDQIKNKQYNYYKLGYDLNTVDEFFTKWINSDPMVSIGGFQHQFVTTINNYTWTYRFNNKDY